MYTMKAVKGNALTREANMDALEMTLLFDYYGELLTERQKQCIDMRYNQDMSLGEIAAELQVSRQGVYDNLNRAEALLRSTEEKTGLIRRDMACRKAAAQIVKLAQQLSTMEDETVSALAASILDCAKVFEE